MNTPVHGAKDRARIAARIEALRQQGHTIESACKQLGVSHNVYYSHRTLIQRRANSPKRHTGNREPASDGLIDRVTSLTIAVSELYVENMKLRKENTELRERDR